MCLFDHLIIGSRSPRLAMWFWLQPLSWLPCRYWDIYVIDLLHKSCQAQQRSPTRQYYNRNRSVCPFFSSTFRRAIQDLGCTEKSHPARWL